MAQTGRTTRMLLRALADLSEGRDIMLVTFDAADAGKLKRQMVAMAKALGIPCRNVRGASPDDPLIASRPYDYVVEQRQVSPRLRVYVDHRAQFSKPWTPEDRSIVGL